MKRMTVLGILAAMIVVLLSACGSAERFRQIDLPGGFRLSAQARSSGYAVHRAQ